MRRRSSKGWASLLQRSLKAFTAPAVRAGRQATQRALAAGVRKLRPPAGAGLWWPGLAVGARGTRRYMLFRPSALPAGHRVPLLVMLHGCGQDASSFAQSTRMNALAARQGCVVLYPEQDRLANLQGCWNWFDTKTGRAYGEAALIMQAVDQVCLLHPVDKTRVAIAGLSAGASMAALLVTRHPGRFKAVVMHSGIPPGTAHSTLSALGAMHGHRMTTPLMTTPNAMEAHWPPLLVIHGDADAVVSPKNGQAAAQVWADAAGAKASEARSVQRGKRYPMSVTDFKRKGSTVATLVAVSGLAHAWSGGLASKAFSDGQGPDASRMVWAFAARQFRGLQVP